MCSIFSNVRFDSFLCILGFTQSLWPNSSENESTICQDHRMIGNIRSQLICQKQCKQFDNCIGTSYPKFNGYTKDCYLCFGDDAMIEPENKTEAGIEFRRRPKGNSISSINECLAMSLASSWSMKIFL